MNNNKELIKKINAIEVAKKIAKNKLTEKQARATVKILSYLQNKLKKEINENLKKEVPLEREIRIEKLKEYKRALKAIVEYEELKELDNKIEKDYDKIEKLENYIIKNKKEIRKLLEILDKEYNVRMDATERYLSVIEGIKDLKQIAKEELEKYYSSLNNRKINWNIDEHIRIVALAITSKLLNKTITSLNTSDIQNVGFLGMLLNVKDENKKEKPILKVLKELKEKAKQYIDIEKVVDKKDLKLLEEKILSKKTKYNKENIKEYARKYLSLHYEGNINRIKWDEITKMRGLMITSYLLNKKLKDLTTTDLQKIGFLPIVQNTRDNKNNVISSSKALNELKENIKKYINIDKIIEENELFIEDEDLFIVKKEDKEEKSKMIKQIAKEIVVLLFNKKFMKENNINALKMAVEKITKKYNINGEDLKDLKKELTKLSKNKKYKKTFERIIFLAAFFTASGLEYGGKREGKAHAKSIKIETILSHKFKTISTYISQTRINAILYDEILKGSKIDEANKWGVWRVGAKHRNVVSIDLEALEDELIKEINRFMVNKK